MGPCACDRNGRVADASSTSLHSCASHVPHCQFSILNVQRTAAIDTVLRNAVNGDSGILPQIQCAVVVNALGGVFTSASLGNVKGYVLQCQRAALNNRHRVHTGVVSTLITSFNIAGERSIDFMPSALDGDVNPALNQNSRILKHNVLIQGDLNLIMVFQFLISVDHGENIPNMVTLVWVLSIVVIIRVVKITSFSTTLPIRVNSRQGSITVGLL